MKENHKKAISSGHILNQGWCSININIENDNIMSIMHLLCTITLSHPFQLVSLCKKIEYYTVKYKITWLLANLGFVPYLCDSKSHALTVFFGKNETTTC